MLHSTADRVAARSPPAVGLVPNILCLHKAMALARAQSTAQSRWMSNPHKANTKHSFVHTKNYFSIQHNTTTTNTTTTTNY